MLRIECMMTVTVCVYYGLHHAPTPATRAPRSHAVSHDGGGVRSGGGHATPHQSYEPVAWSSKPGGGITASRKTNLVVVRSPRRCV
eukprot:COSAG01_NODE_4735_length_4784_cov_8.721878_3_plen_86_part_00